MRLRLRFLIFWGLMVYGAATEDLVFSLLMAACTGITLWEMLE